MFAVLFCLFACLMDAAYMQICANECKYMLHCTSMLPPTWRVALNSVKQNHSKFISQRLIKPCNNG